MMWIWTTVDWMHLSMPILISSPVVYAWIGAVLIGVTGAILIGSVVSAGCELSEQEGSGVMIGKLMLLGTMYARYYSRLDPWARMCLDHTVMQRPGGFMLS